MTRNQDYALVALLIVGGAEESRHLETVAVAAHELAPDRFRWEKYDLPSLETTRVSLRADHGRGADLSRDSKNRYALTASGIERAVHVAASLFSQPFTDARSVLAYIARERPHRKLAELMGDVSPSTRPAQRQVRKIRSSEVYSKWREDPAQEIDRTEAADLLDCLPDSSAAIWKRRISEVERVAEFWSAPDVREFAEAMAKQLVGE